MLPFHRRTNGRQPSKTIETNGCLTPKPSKNHWTQWLSLTIPFNGDGAFQNHWNFAMVAKCGPKSPKSFDYAFSLQNGLVTLKWSGGFIYPLSLSSSAFVRKWDMSRLQAFLGLSNGPKPLLTIVPEFGETIEKPSIAMVNQWKNIQWWWLRGSKTIEKPLIAMVPPKKFITIPSLWKNDHRWSLFVMVWSTGTGRTGKGTVKPS